MEIMDSIAGLFGLSKKARIEKLKKIITGKSCNVLYQDFIDESRVSRD